MYSFVLAHWRFLFYIHTYYIYIYILHNRESSYCKWNLYFKPNVQCVSAIAYLVYWRTDIIIDDVIIKTFFNCLLYQTNRFQVAVRLFSNRSQRTSKCGKNISDTLSYASCATFLFLSVIYYWTDVWQLGIYLLNTYPYMLKF